MVFRRLDAILQDIVEDAQTDTGVDCDSSAGPLKGDDTERVEPVEEDAANPAGKAELPGCMGGETRDTPWEESTAVTFPGVRKTRSRDGWTVRKPTIRRGRAYPKASGRTLGARPRLVAIDGGRIHGSPSA